ncbi:MAG: glutamate--tRNA ligase [Fibrobacteria bacterium]|nr:glutamate--tRNA ligase [Fibrobacteria bacterium]
MTDTKIRVRFAPSPTGTLHVGGARTALFNWLFARKFNGAFILRIEDTDQTRYDKNAEIAMIKDLKWMGLQWDEGPDIGGEVGPYRQSKRLDIYKKYALELIKKGMAYYCFCTSERLDEMRIKQKAEKLAQGYDGLCRNLTPEETDKRLQAGERYVIRLKTPLEGSTCFSDYIRGEISYQNKELDDLILFKSNGFPSYHLANVVDDHLMGITHVMRGDEWIPSTPKHKVLYDSFGWEPPVFMHLPVILAAGGGKLSKRKGAVSVTEYKEMGILPNTLINFLSLLGWNPGDDTELMDRETLIQKFSLDRVNPKSCAFDEKKLEWMNGQYFSSSATETLLPDVKKTFQEASLPVESFDDAYLTLVIDVIKERAKNLSDFVERGSYFYADPDSYDKKAVKKHFKDGAKQLLEQVLSVINSTEDYTEESLEKAFQELANTLGYENAAKIIHPTRLAISGVSFGPGLYQLLVLLNKETVIRRLEKGIHYLESKV